MFLNRVVLILCMDLDLPFGPWNKMVSGQWAAYPITIYQNPDKVLLLVLFDKEADKVKGLLVLMRKALVVDGELSKFLVSQKRELTLIEKFSKDYIARFLLVGASPAYIAYSQAGLVRAVRVQYGELEALTKIASEIASTYGIVSKELKDATEEQAQILLGDPFALLAYSPLPSGAGAISREGMGAGGGIGGARVQLGIDRMKQPVVARLDSLRSVLVVGESEEKRLHALHALVENALLNNVPCMVFDTSGAFSGLSLPNKDSSAFEAFKMTAIPLGFPFKSFELDKGLFVDLSLVSSDLFLSTFSLEKCELAPLLKRAYDAKKQSLASLGDLVLELSNTPEDADFSRYAINKAVRAIEVVQKAHPGLFAKNLSTDVTMPFQGNVGKVIYLNLYGQTPNIQNLVIQSILQPFYASRTPNLSLFLVFEKDAKHLAPEVQDGLHTLAQAGFGFGVQTQNEMDVKIDAGMKVELIGEEAVMAERGEKQKRLVIRPGYSHCSETKIK